MPYLPRAHRWLPLRPAVGFWLHRWAPPALRPPPAFCPPLTYAGRRPGGSGRRRKTTKDRRCLVTAQVQRQSTIPAVDRISGSYQNFDNVKLCFLFRDNQNGTAENINLHIYSDHRISLWYFHRPKVQEPRSLVVFNEEHCVFVFRVFYEGIDSYIPPKTRIPCPRRFFGSES